MEYQAFHANPWQHGSFWVAVAIVIFALLFWRKIAVPFVGMLDARTNAVREALERMALQRIEAAEKSAVNDVRSAAIDIATAATAQILRAGLDADSGAAMIDNAILGVPAALRSTV